MLRIYNIPVSLDDEKLDLKLIVSNYLKVLKRSIKKAIIPGYGKKGTGWIKNPKKAAYNKIYNKTSFSIKKLFK